MSHTEGTWQQSASIIYCGNAVICALSEPRKTEHIEYYPLEIGSPDWQEAMDNGKLIKAAPALLAALMPLANLPIGLWGDSLADKPDDTPVYEFYDVVLTVGHIKAARTAIADAKGEQAEGD